MLRCTHDPLMSHLHSLRWAGLHGLPIRGASRLARGHCHRHRPHSNTIITPLITSRHYSVLRWHLHIGSGSYACGIWAHTLLMCLCWIYVGEGCGIVWFSHSWLIHCSDAAPNPFFTSHTKSCFTYLRMLWMYTCELQVVLTTQGALRSHTLDISAVAAGFTIFHAHNSQTQACCTYAWRARAHQQ